MRCDISNQPGCPARWPRSRDIWRRCVARGSSVWYTRWPKPGIFSLRASFARTTSSALLGRRVRADLEQHAHHVGVGAAVQRSLERADRRRRWPSGCRSAWPPPRARQTSTRSARDRRGESARRRRRASPGRSAARRSACRGKFAAWPSTGSGWIGPPPAFSRPKRRDERAELRRQTDRLAVVGLR